MSGRIRPSKRTRKFKPTSELSTTLVGSRIALSEAGLAERKAASRSITLCESTIPEGWRGQALKSGRAGDVTDRAGEFTRTVHLRGITQRTHNIMIGQTDGAGTLITRPDGTSYRAVLSDGRQLDRRLGKIHAQSPSAGSEDYDPLYHSKVLLRTRKGRKLAQRPASGAIVTLPSQYELAQAGIEYDYRVARVEAETIRQDDIVTHHNQPIAPRIAVSRVLAGLDSRVAALYSASERSREQHNIWSPLAPSVRAGTHADRPEEAGQGDVPTREWWDHRQTGYPRALALLLHATN